MATIISRKPGGSGGGGGAPSGPAGGDLAGTYPNPTIDPTAVVTSIDGTGGPLAGDVTLSEGSGISLTQAGQDIEIAASGGGGYTLIQEIIVPSGGSATVDFTSIPGTYRHLEIFYQAFSENAATQNMFLNFNNDSGANKYRWQFWDPSGSSGQTATTTALCGTLPATSDVSPVAGHICVPYYASALQKVFRAEASGFYAAGNRIVEAMGIWLDTAAITRITLAGAASDIKEGSLFSLYGIT